VYSKLNLEGNVLEDIDIGKQGLVGLALKTREIEYTNSIFQSIYYNNNVDIETGFPLITIPIADEKNSVIVIIQSEYNKFKQDREHVDFQLDDLDNEIIELLIMNTKTSIIKLLDKSATES